MSPDDALREELTGLIRYTAGMAHGPCIDADAALAALDRETPAGEGQPTTGAGRRLLDGFAPLPRPDAQELHRRSAMGRRVKVAAGIVAIEREAAAAPVETPDPVGDDDLPTRLATEGDPRFADLAGRAYIRIRMLQAALSASPTGEPLDVALVAEALFDARIGAPHDAQTLAETLTPVLNRLLASAPKPRHRAGRP